MIQFFLDSANIDEIIEIKELGIIDGITTNPSLISLSSHKFSDHSFFDIVAKICHLIDGDVSVEVLSDNYESMIKEGEKILQLASNIVIKLPMTIDGLKACQYFAANSIKVNMTLCFSTNQAILAAKSGAYYISPFIGRLDDIGSSGIKLIEDIKTIYKNYNIKTKILAASIRSAEHIHTCALIGADVITMPAKVIKGLVHHPLTTKGLEIFNEDWQRKSKAGQ